MGEKGQGDRRESRGGGTRGRSAAASRSPRGPAIRSGVVRVSELAARALRAGHPWVFGDALARPIDAEPGSLRYVVDDRGHGIGWGLVEGEGAIAMHIVSRSDDFAWNEATMEARLRAAAAFRASHVEEGFERACRLVHGAADGFPGIAIDRFGEDLLVYRYARAAAGYLERLLPLLAGAFPYHGVYLQDRVRAVQADELRPAAQLVAGRPVTGDLRVDEDGLVHLVDITAPVSPGLFLDLREGRRLLERLARGRSVLNLFSFTGSLALRAVRGGAASVTNVDAAARSHARCRQNLAASQLDPESCEAVTGDVFKHLDRFASRGRTFDLVVVDPPPFSSVKGSTFSALQDWAELMRAVGSVVAPGGEVLAICNAAGLSEAEFLAAAGEGASRASRHMLLIGECGLPPDFPVIPAFAEGKYLKIKRFHLD